jgi:hypothetical protein
VGVHIENFTGAGIVILQQAEAARDFLIGLFLAS